MVASARDLVPEMCAAIILPIPLGEESVVIRGSLLAVPFVYGEKTRFIKSGKLSTSPRVHNFCYR